MSGCTAHNALVAVYPHRDDFQYVATLTGDSSWTPDNMRKYFVKMENKMYLQGPLSPGHGHNGWLSIVLTPVTLALKDLQLLSMIQGPLSGPGGLAETILNIGTFIAGDANADSSARDSTQALYQIPLSSKNGARA